MAISSDVLAGMDLDKMHTEGYAFLVEMKYHAVKNGFRIKEIRLFSRQDGRKLEDLKRIIFERFSRSGE